MWTEEHRRIYRRDGDGYPSDLRDAEWARLKPLIPKASPGGRPRKIDMRAVITAILYLLRTGCPWRYLPRDSFPPRSTSTTSSTSFSARGYGRRSGPNCIWHCVSEWDARPAPRLRFSTANRSGQRLVLGKIRRRFAWLELIWTDGGYNAGRVEAAVAKVPVLRLEIFKRSNDVKGLIVLSRRWAVERTFSWFGRNRRLTRDFENLAETLTIFVTLASIQLAVRRLAKA